MIDPKILKESQQIVLRQNKTDGRWQEFIVDKDSRILAVEEFKPFEKSKLESSEPNNYEELKKNYYETYKKGEELPPFQLVLPNLDNNELEPPEVDIDDDYETEREPEIEEESEEDEDQEKEPQESDCQLKESEE